MILHQADCMDVLAGMAPDSVHAVITDPPYRMRSCHPIEVYGERHAEAQSKANAIPIYGRNEAHARNPRVPIYGGQGVAPRVNDSYSVGEPWGFSLAWVKEIARLRPLQVITFCNGYMLPELGQALGEFMTQGAVLIWQRTNAPPNVRNTPKWDCEFILWYRHPGANNVRAKQFRSQVIRLPFPSAGCMGKERLLKGNGSKAAAHPTQKPIALMRLLVERLTDPGWTVLDPFMGTGTTGAACLEMDREFIGIERDPDYFRLAEARLAAAQAQLLLPLPAALPAAEGVIT